MEPVKAILKIENNIDCTFLPGRNSVHQTCEQGFNPATSSCKLPFVLMQGNMFKCIQDGVGPEIEACTSWNDFQPAHWQEPAEFTGSY
jgi:hypothetical protein